VPVTLNTDDLTVSDLKLSEEYVNAAEQIGLSLPDLWAINRHALDAAFVDATTRDHLRADFDLWAVNVPELAGPGG
jgi:adenosine deaminase